MMFKAVSQPLIAAFAAIMCLGAAQPLGAPSAIFDAAAWRDDLGQLRHAMSEHYANLEWVAHVRRTDLRLLNESTVQALHNAGSDADAQKAIEDFLAAMGDGHLEVDWAEPQDAASPVAQPLCAQLGYRVRKLSAGLQFQDLPSFRSVSSSAERYFPDYALHLRDGSLIGIIRIGVFSAKWYPELCDAALRYLGLSQSSHCDDACSDRVQYAAENVLTEKLNDAIAALEKQPHLRLIAIDLTKNGGGTDWLEPAMRELTAVPLRSPKMGFVKHQHWQGEFEHRISVIQNDMPRAPAAYRTLLARALRTYQRLLAISKQRCDQSPLWNDEPVACSIVGQGAMYTTGILSYAKPGSLPAGFGSAEFIFLPSLYRYREGVYRGKLAVLVDENTASAAERFAAILQDNRAARIVGVPTYGAGCGYTNGGIPTTLSHSGASVMMPDCVQYRADGSNAVAGITPDVLVPWHANDNKSQRAQRAFETLAQ